MICSSLHFATRLPLEQREHTFGDKNPPVRSQGSYMETTCPDFNAKLSITFIVLENSGLSCSNVTLGYWLEPPWST